MRTFFLTFSFLILTHSLFAVKYFVTPGGNNSNDGLSWTTAKANIGGAITAAAGGDTIFVAVGTYTSSFSVPSTKSGISIYGGFSGFEASLEERPNMNYGETEYGQTSRIVSSSDLPVNLQNAYTSLVTFDGFTVQATSESIYGIAAIRCASRTKISNCKIMGGNRSGIRVDASSTNVTIENCLITQNGVATTNTFYDYDGGGIHTSSATVTIKNCIIDNNGGQSGVVYIAGNGNVTMIDCSITNNKGAYTSGIHNIGTVSLTNCLIINNKAEASTGNSTLRVGGIYTSGNATITGCIIANNSAINTHATGYYAAGGIMGAGTTAKNIVNSSIVNNFAQTNHANATGGIYCSSNTFLIDCIVWGNKKGTQFSQLFNTPSATNYSAIQGVTQTGMANINLAADNTGSESGVYYPRFDTPTLFVGCGTNTEENLQVMQANWRLTQGSACINTGIPNTSSLNLPETDIYGAPRIVDGRIDIGAAEYNVSSQVIAWDQTLNFSVYDGSVQLTATATSGLPVTYTSNNPIVATINGSMLMLHSAGDAIITAFQAGNEFYDPAPEVSKPLTVTNMMNQTITWNQTLEAFVGDPPVTLSATASSGLQVSYTSSNPSVATVAGNILTIMGAGTSTITAKQAGNASYYPAPDIPKTLTVTQSALSGTVIIEGNVVWGQTLFANTTGLTSTPAGAILGTLTYQWKRGGANINGATSATYMLVQSDIGYAITVTVTAANCTGSVTSNPTAIVAKATQTAPPAPTLLEKTATSIKLNDISDCEYNINGGAWQSSPTFAGLIPATTYTFTQRKAETPTHLASPTSESATFTTEETSNTIYTITASVNNAAWGAITPHGEALIEEGSNITFYITPYPGYTIDNILVNGVFQGAIGIYTFYNVQSNGTIAAVFKHELGITETAPAKIAVYPNPTTGKLKIESGELRIEDIVIFDIYGRKQKIEGRKKKEEGEVLMDISELSAGVYFLRIRTEQGEVVRKVMKE